MAFINITTNNQSRELTNSTTFEDNWVYVPGVAITGDYSRPYAFRSLQDFKDTFGYKGPEDSITFQYVTGLLNAGLPVLFRRIACYGQDTQDEVEAVKHAKGYAKYPKDSATEESNMLLFEEKYGGTFGNDLHVTIRDTGYSYWFDVYYKYTLLESVKVIDYTSTDTAEQKAKKMIEKIPTLAFDRIKVDVVQKDKSKFNLVSNDTIYLSGGFDFVEDEERGKTIEPEIVHSFDYIKDKIMYQPKFLTSGGYTDSLNEFESAQGHPIIDKMKEISELRQDCRALIDLPSNADKSQQLGLAEAVAYQQSSNTQAIPSASVCAPWCYMQVGNEQLWMPPSYVYLTVVGDELSRGGRAYTPKAGLSSGKVKNIIRPQFELGSDKLEEWQADGGVNINPIMRLQSSNYVIAGNSTLLRTDSNESNAFAESSADLTVIEIRRFVYNLASELQYQYNSTSAFETFSLKTAKFLEMMISEGAITQYEINNISTNSEPRKLKIQLNIYLSPTIKNIEILLNVAYGSVEVTTGGVE